MAREKPVINTQNTRRKKPVIKTNIIRSATPKRITEQDSTTEIKNANSGSSSLMARAGNTVKAGALSTAGSFTELAAQATPVTGEQHLGQFSGFGDLGRAVRESREKGGSIEEITQRLEQERRDRREKQRQAAFDAATRLFEKSAQAQEQAKEGAGTVGRFLVDMGVTGTQMAGDALMNLALPGSGLAMMGMRSYGQAANEARQQGKSEDKQVLAGLKAAGIETFTEKMFGAFSKIYGKAGADELVEKLVNKLTQNKAGQSVLTWLVNSSGEGVEEVASDLLNPLADKLLQLDDGEALYTTDDVAQMGYDFLLGSAMGLVGGTGQLARDAKQSRKKLPQDSKTAQAVEAVTRGETISGNQAAAIAKDPVAVKALEQSTGVKMNTQQPLSTLKKEIQAISTRDTARETQTEATPTPTAQKRTQRPVGGFMEAGQKAYSAMRETAGSDAELYAGFASVYNAGLNGIDADKAKGRYAAMLTPEQRYAAYNAGLEDAAAQVAKENADVATVTTTAGAGLADNEYSRFVIAANKDMASALNEVGKKLGVRIEFVDSVMGGQANGQYIKDKNLIQIAANEATRDRPVLEVAVHEITHRMQDLAPEEYRAFRKAAIEQSMAKNGADTEAEIVQWYIDKAENAGVTLTQDEAMDEIAADFAGRMIEDTDLFARFAKDNRTAAQKLLDRLKEFIAKVKSIFTGKARDAAAQEAYGKDFAELEAVAQKWQEAFDAAEQQAEKTKNAAGEGDGVKYSLKNTSDKTVVSIKQQIANASQTLNDTEPVGQKNVSEIFSEMNIKQKRAWAETEALKYGNRVDRQGYGSIEVSRKDVNSALNYLQSDGEIAAFAALPYVLKRGREIYREADHKGRGYSTVTFSAPVVINGVRGNMAVVVRETSKNHYDMHRIVMPDGSAFTFAEKTNAETGPTAATSSTDALTQPTASTSKNSIPTGGENVNGKFQLRGTERLSEELEDLRDTYIRKYGEIPEGENATRKVRMPRKTSDEKKVSQTVRTILEAKATPDEIVPSIEELALRGEYSYEAYSDEKAISDATAKIKDLGWAKSLSDWMDAIKKGNVSKANTAMGWALYNNAANSGDTSTALEILSNMVEHQRSAAQALQATRILKTMNPETQLYQVQRSVANLQEEINGRYRKGKAPELKIDQKLAEQFMRARDQTERDAALDDIYRDIGRQMPSRFIDKWNAWRYLAMLGNARTHVRNVVGNAGFAPVVAVKNTIATGIEAGVSKLSGGKLNRSKALVTGKEGKALREAAAADFAKIQEVVMGSGKYSDFANANSRVEEGRVIFQSKVPVLKQVNKGLEWARKANSAALEAEDMLFSKPHYANAMAQYCKANGITAEMIAKGEGIKKAREYAIREAQKATYRDTNAFSQFISEIGRRRGSKTGVEKFATGILEGILPFRKTPANILARGVEYSPIGLAKGIKQALFDVRTGKKTGAEVIDSISAGLTGSGLLALGMYLASQALLRGHGSDDDDKNEFSELQGHQTYSLELPDGTSVTLDWLAPECLPLFIGVNLWEQMNGDLSNFTLAKGLQAASNVSEPLLEMSCLQSLNDVFDAVGYVKSDGLSALPKALASAATSYLTQALPTLLGQVERTGEDMRYTTFTDKTNPYLTTDMQYTLGKASARIPGWDYNQIPYIDAWGRTESTGEGWERAVNNFLNPAYVSQITEGPMETELLRLYNATGESVFPSRAGKDITVSGEKVVLNADTYVKYATQKGQGSYKRLTALTNDLEYKKLNDSQKANCVELIYKMSDQLAKSSVSKYEPDSWVTKAKKAEQMGISATDFVVAKTKTSGIVSLKDKEGSPIKNSKSLLVMEQIYTIGGLTSKQREYLFEAMGVSEGVRHYNKSLVQQELRKMRKK